MEKGHNSKGTAPLRRYTTAAVPWLDELAEMVWLQRLLLDRRAVQRERESGRREPISTAVAEITKQQPCTPHKNAGAAERARRRGGSGAS